MKEKFPIGQAGRNAAEFAQKIADEYEGKKIDEKPGKKSSQKKREVSKARESLAEKMPTEQKEALEELIDKVRKFESVQLTHYRSSHHYLRSLNFPSGISPDNYSGVVRERINSIIEKRRNRLESPNLEAIKKGITEFVAITPSLETQESTPADTTFFTKVKDFFSGQGKSEFSSGEEYEYREIDTQEIFPNEESSPLYDFSYLISDVTIVKGKLDSGTGYGNISLEMKLPKDIAIQLLDAIKSNPQLIRDLARTIHDEDLVLTTSEQVNWPNFKQWDELGAKMMIIDHDGKKTIKKMGHDSGDGSDINPSPDDMPPQSPPDDYVPSPDDPLVNKAAVELELPPDILLGSMITISKRGNKKEYMVVAETFEEWTLMDAKSETQTKVKKDDLINQIKKKKASHQYDHTTRDRYLKWKRRNDSVGGSTGPKSRNA